MKIHQVIIISCLLVGAIAPSILGDSEPQRHEIRKYIFSTKVTSHDSLTVHFENKSEKAIRIWHPDCSWGDTCVSLFTQSKPGDPELRHEVEARTFSINFPRFIEVPAGAKVEIPYDVSDESWGAIRKELSAPVYRARFEYESPSTKEALDQDVFRGRIIGQWFSL